MAQLLLNCPKEGLLELLTTFQAKLSVSSSEWPLVACLKAYPGTTTDISVSEILRNFVLSFRNSFSDFGTVIGAVIFRDGELSSFSLQGISDEKLREIHRFNFWNHRNISGKDRGIFRVYFQNLDYNRNLKYSKIFGRTYLAFTSLGPYTACVLADCWDLDRQLWSFSDELASSFNSCHVPEIAETHNEGRSSIRRRLKTWSNLFVASRNFSVDIALDRRTYKFAVSKQGALPNTKSKRDFYHWFCREVLPRSEESNNCFQLTFASTLLSVRVDENDSFKRWNLAP